MGDNGFLRKLYVQVRTPNIYGDVTWYRGKVVEKVQDGGPVVKVEITGINRSGETTTQGRAEVVLPTRSGG